MQTYIGNKVINAKPMTRLEYNKFRGWKLPENENGNDLGYLVEYVDGGLANYVSWSPAEVFDREYRPTSEMSFGVALVLLKSGHKVARKGWNGKDMFLFAIAGGAWNFETDIDGVDDIETLPFTCMKTADDKLVPWLASQTDMLSEDWTIVE